MEKTTKEIFKRIRRIEITTTKLVEELLAGAYRSAFKGNGIEFEEVREYIPGDDIRTIDWNVTARMNRPFVKTFREERELTVFLMVDISASSRFGSKDRMKSELIAEISAALAFSAIRNQDKVGLILFSDQVELYIPPRKGKRHVLRVIRDILIYEPKRKKTNIATALQFLGNVQRRTAVCFLVSDFLCPSNFQHELKINAKHHDLILLGVKDPLEKSFPPYSLVTLRDLETGEVRVVDSGDAEVQAGFHEQIEIQQESLKKLVNRLGISFLEFSTHQPYAAAIRQFFKERGKKR
ncbi:MAG: hypothetical protein K940chlam3_01378 [Chlamydiae bacterium]|nr:hypothetical protein [Chlamydiota bacterium]